MESGEGVVDVAAGEAIVTRRGERVRYSTPNAEAEYIAICLPAFSPEPVNPEAECAALMLGASATDESGVRPFEYACGDTAQVFASERILS